MHFTILACISRYSYAFHDSRMHFTILLCAFTILLCTFTIFLCAFAILLCTFTILPCTFTILPCAFAILLCTFRILPCTFTIFLCAFAILPCTFTIFLCNFTILLCAFTILLCNFTIRHTLSIINMPPHHFRTKHKRINAQKPADFFHIDNKRNRINTIFEKKPHEKATPDTPHYDGCLQHRKRPTKPTQTSTPTRSNVWLARRNRCHLYQNNSNSVQQLAQKNSRSQSL